MGPVRCHRFSRFFSLRFTAQAYFPWETVRLLPAAICLVFPAEARGKLEFVLQRSRFSAPLFFCDLERKKTL